MELVKSVRAWFKKDVVYEKVRPGFHPYLQTDTSYSAHPREIDPCHQPDFMVADVDLPAWSSILSLYPDLTSDPGFDQRKLAMFIRKGEKEAGLDYLMDLLEQKEHERFELEL